MEHLVELLAGCAGFLVPAVAIWATACLYTMQAGSRCPVTECVFFVALLAISCVTIRTVMANDYYWLLHTSSLGAMIVAGVLKKPRTVIA